jgi:hypothetical protein
MAVRLETILVARPFKLNPTEPLRQGRGIVEQSQTVEGA